ncbi:hypothetical protein FQA39_LY07803 [Lamprigera yunnana]|nr:hypothetical protein FQA39_LY07803 [Lamprigera yunnana]
MLHPMEFIRRISDSCKVGICDPNLKVAFKMEQSLNALTQIQRFVSKNDGQRALKIIKQQQVDGTLSDTFANVTSYLVAQINEARSKDDILLSDCAQEVLEGIAEECDPEDTLLQLMEHIEKTTYDRVFLILTKVLLKVLLRIPKNRLNSLGWGLNAVHSYIKRIEITNANVSEDNDDDEVVARISFLLSSLLPFYTTLIEQMRNSDEGIKMVALKFALSLFGRPTALLDLKTKDIISEARRVSETLINQIFKLNSDIYLFLDVDPNHDVGHVNLLALGTLYYLVLAERVMIEKLPKVYDNVYVFQKALPLVIELLSHENQFTQHNGLHLIKVLINGVTNCNLSYHLLDSEHHCHFCKTLVSVSTYNQSTSVRKTSLEIFRKYLFLFDSKGRYLLIYNLMRFLNHTGIIGFIITQYKDMIMQEFDKPTLSEYFHNLNLYKILDIFCHLRHREESDLIELTDQIVASLNLLRFLAIKDISNKTGIWENYFKKLQKGYLNDLKKGLILSRAHYEMKIKDVQEEQAGKGESVSMMIEGQLVTRMPPEEKIDFLQLALTSFDMIENLLSYLNQVIEP